MEGRVRVVLTICDYYKRYLDWKVCSSDLCFRKDGRAFLHVVVSKEEEVFSTVNEVVGVDLGINRPAVTSDAKFFGKRRWKNTQKRYFNPKRDLQSKGTKSSKRHLKALSKKENRFRKDCDHVISRQIIDSVSPGSVVIIEDLVNIRGRAKARKQQRRYLHSWSFKQLQDFLKYKGKAKGVTVDYVDPRYTSQKCSKCGYIDKGNRKSQSWFVCKKCGYQLNADYNASINICQNYLASKGISAGSGAVAKCPIVG